MNLPKHLSREPGLTARSLADAHHLQGMAASFAKFNEVAQEHVASGEPYDPGLLTSHYEDVCEVLHDAQQLGGLHEPELLAAITDLQRARDTARELLPCEP